MLGPCGTPFLKSEDARDGLFRKARYILPARFFFFFFPGQCPPGTLKRDVAGPNHQHPDQSPPVPRAEDMFCVLFFRSANSIAESLVSQPGTMAWDGLPFFRIVPPHRPTSHRQETFCGENPLGGPRRFFLPFPGLIAVFFHPFFVPPLDRACEAPIAPASPRKTVYSI